MNEIEDEINDKLERRIENDKWLDYTDQIHSNQAGKINNVQYFLVLS